MIGHISRGIHRPSLLKTFLFAQQPRQRMCVVKMYKNPPTSTRLASYCPSGNPNFYPFTAPAVRPWMKYRCKKTKMTVTGTAATILAAII